MSDTVFTPGPWYWFGDDGETVVAVDDAMGGPVAVLQGNHSRLDADAHLIAAAPELYEALGSLLEDTQHAHHPDCTDGPCPVALARAALGKARGES